MDKVICPGKRTSCADILTFLSGHHAEADILSGCSEACWLGVKMMIISRACRV
jgi:hypothetical protein